MIKKYLFSTSLHDQRKIYETFGENRLHFRTVKIKFYTEKAGINAILKILQYEQFPFNVHNIFGTISKHKGRLYSSAR